MRVPSHSLGNRAHPSLLDEIIGEVEGTYDRHDPKTLRYGRGSLI